jgi:branched-subunit amino acid transport protein AzlD
MGLAHTGMGKTLPFGVLVLLVAKMMDDVKRSRPNEMHALILALLSNICIIKSDCVVYLDV